MIDITAGGGSIPFEAGRLGLRSHANELNPVAQFILRATCQWPQQYGDDLLDKYHDVSNRFRLRVKAVLENIYPEEPEPLDDPIFEIRTQCVRKGTGTDSSGRA